MTMEETLFDRMVTAEAVAADWDELEDVAAHDPDVWRRLGMALRDHGELTQLVGLSVDDAERVDLAPYVATRSRWGPRSGWLAAAAVLLVWVGVSVVDLAPTRESGDTGLGEAPALSVPAGDGSRVVGELPAVLVGTRELPDGEGVEVTYLRRLVERRTTRGLFEKSEDEWGNPVAVPTNPTTWQEEL